ncbi:hypothetical protein SAMN04488103_12412 [Gemmobacter aquatilis]|uniref:Uncharacterized protein n=1 Tax=Gemmobacter aquatilis TaxID=933059 RepID=A0A1H8NVH6_9RHOB|nr:hypothetical protein [Gemmobacter aquatilis]SEO33591.1 hypothetical protein SAMN04488103_12412 [Gemmobacter aquatilis]
MSKTRFQFDVKDERVEEIKALMDDIGADSNRELFNNALTLLEWAVEEVKNGNTIASINEANKVYRELQMPALKAAASRMLRRQGGATARQFNRADDRVQQAV